MQNDELSFLSDKITETNFETDFFLLNSDPVFVSIPQNEDNKRDQVFLQFKQKIREIPEHNQTDILKKYYSKFHDKSKDTVPFYVHEIIYQDKIKEKLIIDDFITCAPTLSFRTLKHDANNHIKFGLPFFYGNVIRVNTKKEVLSSLYLSDYIQGLPKINKLDFFKEYKGYSINSLEDYSVSYRRNDCQEDTTPISCYFNYLLNFSEEKATDRLESTLSFLSIFFHDFNTIHKELKTYGLGLEIHGQNLLVKLNAEGLFNGEYIYRDLGTCSLAPEKQKEQIDLNHYYKLNYDFEYKNLIDAGYYAWINYRTFYLSFFLYNLNQFVVTEKIELNVYDWFDKLTDNLPEIKGIY